MSRLRSIAAERDKAIQAAGSKTETPEITSQAKSA
jgi:hypothetical protein